MKKTKRKTSTPYKWVPGVSLMLLIFGLAVLVRHDRNQDNIVSHSEAEYQERYDYLLEHVAQTNVHPLLRAVHFTIGKYFDACGTMVLNADGTPYFIVTANHLFSETQPGSDYYDYHVLGPNGYGEQGHISRVVLDSIRSSNVPEGIQDVAFCYIGEPAPISRTSKVLVSASSPFSQSFQVGKLAEQVDAVSITTGEHCKIIGQIVNNQNVPYFIMLYKSVNGESGSGFWGSDKRLYIISGGVVVSPETRKELLIPSTYDYVTVLSAVNVHW